MANPKPVKKGEVYEVRGVELRVISTRPHIAVCVNGKTGRVEPWGKSALLAGRKVGG